LTQDTEMPPVVPFAGPEVPIRLQWRPRGDHL